jgi:hypothetical protein
MRVLQAPKPNARRTTAATRTPLPVHRPGRGRLGPPTHRRHRAEQRRGQRTATRIRDGKLKSKTGTGYSHSCLPLSVSGRPQRPGTGGPSLDSAPRRRAGDTRRPATTKAMLLEPGSMIWHVGFTSANEVFPPYQHSRTMGSGVSSPVDGSTGYFVIEFKTGKALAACAPTTRRLSRQSPLTLRRKLQFRLHRAVPGAKA